MATEGRTNESVDSILIIILISRPAERAILKHMTIVFAAPKVATKASSLSFQVLRATNIGKPLELGKVILFMLVSPER